MSSCWNWLFGVLSNCCSCASGLSVTEVMRATATASAFWALACFMRLASSNLLVWGRCSAFFGETVSVGLYFSYWQMFGADAELFLGRLLLLSFPHWQTNILSSNNILGPDCSVIMICMEKRPLHRLLWHVWLSLSDYCSEK